MNTKAIQFFKNFSSKQMKSTSTLVNNKIIAKVGAAQEQLSIDSPFEAMLGCLGNCTIHTIMFYAGKNKVKIKNIEVDVVGEYDTDLFLGKKEGKNTFSNIDIKTRVYSTEDQSKLNHVIEEGHKHCPVLSTLKLAGIDFKSEIKYL
jgi:uncharacterized OsmC-like protein